MAALGWAFRGSAAAGAGGAGWRASPARLVGRAGRIGRLPAPADGSVPGPRGRDLPAPARDVVPPLVARGRAARTDAMSDARAAIL